MTKSQKKRNNGDFATQLSVATSRPIPASKSYSAKPSFRNRSPSFKLNFVSNLSSCSRWRGDGDDHINIGKRSADELGQALYTSFDLKFSNDIFGNFNSISRLWDTIDQLVGGKSVYQPESEIFFILADAMWQKVNQYPDLAGRIKAENRPFDMYSFNDVEIPVRSALSWWWLETIYAIRDALRRGLEYPNFKGLVQGKVYDRNQIMENFLNTYVPNRPSNQSKTASTKQTSTEAPSLIRTLRESAPVVVGQLRRFGLSVQPGKTVKIENPVAVPVAEPVAEASAAPVSEVAAEQPAVDQDLKVDVSDAVAEEVTLPTAEVAEPALKEAETEPAIEAQVEAVSNEPDHANDESFKLPSGNETILQRHLDDLRKAIGMENQVAALGGYCEAKVSMDLYPAEHPTSEAAASVVTEDGTEVILYSEYTNLVLEEIVAWSTDSKDVDVLCGAIIRALENDSFGTFTNAETMDKIFPLVLKFQTTHTGDDGTNFFIPCDIMFELVDGVLKANKVASQQPEVAVTDGPVAEDVVAEDNVPAAEGAANVGEHAIAVGDKSESMHSINDELVDTLAIMASSVAERVENAEKALLGEIQTDGVLNADFVGELKKAFTAKYGEEFVNSLFVAHNKKYLQISQRKPKSDQANSLVILVTPDTFAVTNVVPEDANEMYDLSFEL